MGYILINMSFAENLGQTTVTLYREARAPALGYGILGGRQGKFCYFNIDLNN